MFIFLGKCEYHVMFRLTTIIAVALFAQPAWALASPGPRALHVLIKIADVIAVVDVTERLEIGFGRQVKAKVNQVVYGEVTPSQIITISEFDLDGCAGPPAKYEVGQRILVLLRGNQRQGYQACGNLYGARVLSDDQRAQCIKRINEFYRIRVVKDEEKRKLFWTEWAVRCVEQPSTLADGLALLGRGTRLEFGLEPTPDAPAWYFSLVNQEQKGRLFQVLKGVLESDCRPEEFCDLMRVISYVEQHKELRNIVFEAEREMPDRDSHQMDRDEWITRTLAQFFEVLAQHEEHGG